MRMEDPGGLRARRTRFVVRAARARASVDGLAHRPPRRPVRSAATTSDRLQERGARAVRPRRDADRPPAVRRGREDPRPGRDAAADWPVDGTTGYDFLERGQRRCSSTAATSARVERRSTRASRGARRRFAELAYRGEEADHARALASEMNVLAHRARTASPSATAATATSR